LSECTDFFLFLGIKQIYFIFTSYNWTAQYHHEIISSCQRHVGTSHKKHGRR